MQILENVELKTKNTFGVKAKAKFLVEIKEVVDLLELINSDIFKNNKKLFLGKGSNILFTEDFDGLIIENDLKGIEILKENDNEVLVKSFGGELWNDLVEFTVDKGYWGIENLALIPGTVGAAPVQNIGAYGAELKDAINSVIAIDIYSGKERLFSKEECHFGYRDSVFKQELKDKYFITEVVFQLSKITKVNTKYKVLSEYIEKNNLEIKNSRDVSVAVSCIRRSKLPDPKVLGNAGSFFKNAYVSLEKLEELILIYPDMPYFKEGEKIKIPAAWLVESCGFKGKIFGNVGVHDKQALIIVNHGDAEGKDIKNLAYKIIQAVKDKFDIEISPEVNLF